MKYEKLTPIFDTDQSMQCSKITSKMNFYDGYGKFFYNTNKKFSDYLNYISNLSRFDLSLLGNIVEEYKIFYINIEKRWICLKQELKN